MPQSRTNAVPANGVVKCDQNASRVPGCAHAARMPTPVSIAEVTTRITPVSVSTETSAPRSAGWLRMRSATRIVKSTPSPAMLPNVIVQVVACRSAASGTSAIELSGLADDAGELHHERAALCGEPGRDEAQHGRGRSPHRRRRAARVR